MDSLASSVSKPRKKSSKPNPTTPKQATKNTSRRLTSRIKKPGSARSSPTPSHARKVQPPTQKMSSTTERPVQDESLQYFASLDLERIESLHPHSWHHSQFVPQNTHENLVPPFSTSNFESSPWSLMVSDESSCDFQTSPGAISSTPQLDEMLQTPPTYFHTDSFDFSVDNASNPIEIPASVTFQESIVHNINHGVQQLQLSGNMYPQDELLFALDDPSDQTPYAVPAIPLPELSFDRATVIEENMGDENDYQEVETLALATDSSVAKDEELVGLGLHDNAADTACQHQKLIEHDSTTLCNGLNPSPGKGLKLEETWEPPQQSFYSLHSNLSFPYGNFDAVIGDTEVDPFFEQPFLVFADNDPLGDFSLYFSDGRLALTDTGSEHMFMNEEKMWNGPGGYPNNWFGQNGLAQLI